VTTCRVRRLAGGTYTPGTDWSAQFEGEDATYVFTMDGQINLPALTVGQCADIAFVCQNDCSLSGWLEVPSGGTVQVSLNGARDEVAASAFYTLSCQRGLNVLRLTTDTGGFFLGIQLFTSQKTSQWVSLLPSGQDPFASATGGVTPDTGVVTA
jgi:hypothetical protein